MNASFTLAADSLLHKASDVEPPAEALAQQTSVVVVAYNSGGFLQDCITSICSTQPEVEVWVVDNGSTDGAARRVKAEFPAINVLRSAQNAGFGAGGNLGAARASGVYLVFVNPDAVFTQGWLEALVRPLAENPAAGLVTAKVLLRHDPGHINVAGLDVHLSGISMCRGLGSPQTAFGQAKDVAAISGVAFAVRREVFEAIGGLDEDFFLYLEDVDLSARVWLAGYRCLYVPRAVVLHDYQLQVDTHKTFFVERGRYLMLLKIFHWRTLLALLPTLLLAEAITLGWLLWRNPRAIVQKLRAWSWVLSHRTQLIEKRRQVQSYRICPDATFLTHCQWQLNFAPLSNPQIAWIARVVFNPLLRSAAWLAGHLMQR
jgi:GT2 family glycosyltransferase